MIIYSEVLKEQFKTVEECLAAEKAYEEEKASKELVREQKKQEIIDAFNEWMSAKDKYLRLKDEYTKEYGPFRIKLNYQKAGAKMTDEQYKEINDFLKRRWQMDADFLQGNCYWFAHILITRFPFLKLYYEPVVGHFYAGNGDLFFDWGGCTVLDHEPFLFERIEKDDPLWYSRIVRDCIL